MHKPPPQQILIHLHIYTSWPWRTLRLHWYHFSCQYYRYQYTTPWVYWSVLIPILTLQIPIHYFLSIGQSDTNTDTTDTNTLSPEYWSVLIPILTLQIPIHYLLSIGQSDTKTDTTDTNTLSPEYWSVWYQYWHYRLRYTRRNFSAVSGVK